LFDEQAADSIHLVNIIIGKELLLFVQHSNKRVMMLVMMMMMMMIYDQ
jgi:hypothetical protein